jgi:hypothetical protein
MGFAVATPAAPAASAFASVIVFPTIASSAAKARQGFT